MLRICGNFINTWWPLSRFAHFVRGKAELAFFSNAPRKCGIFSESELLIRAAGDKG